MQVDLYVFAGSHPCEAVMAAARHKSIEYRHIELLPVWHRFYMLARFREGTVPGMIADGRKVVGTRKIMRAFDEMRPEPSLLPADPAMRAEVEQAEDWGERVLQDIGRRLIWSHFKRDTPVLKTWAATAPDPRVRRLKTAFAVPMAKIAATANRANDANVRADLAALPALLNRVDELIEQGVIGGAAPNAADFQILSSIGLWTMMHDLRPAIVDRPCGKAAAKLFPMYRDSVPGGILPAEWLAPLRAPRTGDAAL
jgi:glutathione S-transferase